MLVAKPQAIPAGVPLARQLGNKVPSTIGSVNVSSKLGWKSTISLLRSLSIASPYLVSLVSVYLIAAAGSPSRPPLLPCTYIVGYLIIHS